MSYFNPSEENKFFLGSCNFKLEIKWAQRQGNVERIQEVGMGGVLTEIFSQLNPFASKQFNLLLTVFSKIF